MSVLKTTLTLASAIAVCAAPANARDNIHSAGSSTVLPYATIVAEAFGENFDFPTPLVESGGSGAGRKKMCEGVGTNTTDIANSSSRIKQSDIDNCKSNGVNEIMEVRIGYDGIVFASRHENSGFEALTPAMIYEATSASSSKTNWQEIDPNLPNRAIMMFIPGTKHGTREVFDKKVLEAGCKAVGHYDSYKEQNGGDKKKAAKACHKVRTDGRSVDIDGDYTETLARLSSNPEGVGVFGLSFLLNNTNKIYAATINGVAPSTDTIASGEYPVSRPLYFYVKNAHLDVVPGLQEYIEFFVSDDIAGPDGPLAEYGLVSDPELEKTQEMVANRVPMGPLD